MKIKGLLIIVICMIGLSGCTSKGFDIERVYQFVEDAVTQMVKR